MLNLTEAILQKFAVSDEAKGRLKKLENFDLEFVTSAFNDNLIRAGRPYSVEQVYPIIARFGRADYEIAKRLETEFRRFVAITLLTPKVPHAPPGAVDMYWHFFILHTTEYESFCNDVWGNFEGDPKYRHHFPANDDTRPGMLQAYIATRRVYVEVYGEPLLYERAGALAVEIWTEGSHTSGDSYSGIVERNSNLQVSTIV